MPSALTSMEKTRSLPAIFLLHFEDVRWSIHNRSCIKRYGDGPFFTLPSLNYRFSNWSRIISSLPKVWPDKSERKITKNLVSITWSSRNNGLILNEFEIVSLSAWANSSRALTELEIPVKLADEITEKKAYNQTFIHRTKNDSIKHFLEQCSQEEGIKAFHWYGSQSFNFAKLIFFPVIWWPRNFGIDPTKEWFFMTMMRSNSKLKWFQNSSQRQNLRANLCSLSLGISKQKMVSCLQNSSAGWSESWQQKRILFHTIRSFWCGSLETNSRKN